MASGGICRKKVISMLLEGNDANEEALREETVAKKCVASGHESWRAWQCVG